MDDAVLPDVTVPLPREQTLSPLHERMAGHSVISELLSLQQAARPRSWLARLLGSSPLLENARPWHRGALGEMAVGRLLAKLPEGWHVLHAVPVGKGSSDVDHVVIGPGGVFTINTKNHSGQKVWVGSRALMVNGQKQDHLRNAEHEAERAGRLLSAAADAQVSVTPVVAVVEPQSMTVREKPAKVVVLTAAQLVRWLKKRPQVFTSDQVAWLVRRRTCRPRGTSRRPSLRPRLSFEARSALWTRRYAALARCGGSGGPGSLVAALWPR